MYILAEQHGLAFGFRQIGRRRGYYPKSGEDAIVMLRELGSGRSPAQGASVEAGD